MPFHAFVRKVSGIYRDDTWKKMGFPAKDRSWDWPRAPQVASDEE